MQMPFTPLVRQKLLTAVIVLAAAALAATGIYAYERYCRGPSESAFCGTWQGIQDDGDTVQWQFLRDHTFRNFVFSRVDGEKLPMMTGRWHAGGPYLYLRVADEDWPDHVVTRFDITPGHLKIVTPHRREVVWEFDRISDAP